MVPERAAGGPGRRTGATVEGSLEDHGGGAIRQEAELRDGGSEQGDDRCPDPGGHMHDAGVARDDDPRAREQAPGLLQRALAGGALGGARCRQLLGQPPVVGPADHDWPKSRGAEPLGERAPVRDGPALGGVRRARRERGDPGVGQASLGQPLRRAVAGPLAQAKLGRSAVGLGVESPGRLEVPFGHRSAPAVGIDLRADE